MSVSFVSFYKMTESLAQQMHHCVCKKPMATTGTRPRLVTSQYIVSYSSSFIILLQVKDFYVTMCDTIVPMLQELENVLITQGQTALDNGVIIMKCL